MEVGEREAEDFEGRNVHRHPAFVAKIHAPDPQSPAQR